MEVGSREIRLTALDAGLFGLDRGTDLPALLKMLSGLEGGFRVRVGMMNPDSALKDLRYLLWAFLDPKVFKFLHIPVQSGDNAILKKMNRSFNDMRRILPRHEGATTLRQ